MIGFQMGSVYGQAKVKMTIKQNLDTLVKAIAKTESIVKKDEKKEDI